MQANCDADCIDFHDTVNHVLTANMADKKSTASATYNMDSNLNYHQQSKTLDTEARDHVIVEFCVEKQYDESDRSNSISIEAYARKQLERRSSHTRKVVQQRQRPSDLRLDCIPSTLQTATDCSSKQLNSTAFVTSNCRIRPEVAPISVTKHLEQKKQAKSEKGTANADNLHVRLKRANEKKANNKNNHNNCAYSSKHTNEPTVEPCVTLKLDKSKSKNSENSKNDRNFPASEKHQNKKVCIKKNGVTSERSEIYDLQNHNQQQATVTESRAKSTNFVQNKAPISSKSRYHQLKLKSGLSRSKRTQHYQSAIDLSYREKTKTEECQNNKNLTLYSKKNASSIVLSSNQKSEGHTFEKASEFSKNKVIADKKRLCKSLSNLTADDVLSVPCSSIFDRKPTPPNIRKNLRLSHVNLTLKEEISVHPISTEVRI